MKNKNLLKVLALAALPILTAGVAEAQAPQPHKENIGYNLGGTRFMVNTPASISGLKKINFATWGKAATPTIVDMPVVKAYDTLAAATLLNNTPGYPVLTGKYALVFRGGGINFSDKVNRCIAAGASGVIVVNNVPGGELIAMGATPTGTTASVPVFMITYEDGIAINNALLASTEVKITLGTWNTGNTHDLGIVSNYVSTPHALNVPLSMYGADASSILNKHYLGAAIANYGTVTEYNVTVTDSVYWTPKSGSPRSFVTSASASIDSITVADSIKFVFGAEFNVPSPSGEGKYEHVYTVTSDATDEAVEDNRFVLTQNITDGIYSKTHYDFTNKVVKRDRGFGPAKTAPAEGTIPNTIGTILFAGAAQTDKFQHIQYSVSKNGDLLTGSFVNSFLIKWTDGIMSPSSVTTGLPASKIALDSIPQMGELEIVGIANRTFKVTDSSGKIYTDKFVDPSNPTNDDYKVPIDANAFYLLITDIPEDHYIGYDENISYFTRAYAQFKDNGGHPTTGVIDRAEAATYNSDFMQLKAGDTVSMFSYPFSVVSGFGNVYYVDSIYFDRYDKLPALALVSSNEKILDPVSIGEKTKALAGIMNVFPNPANNQVAVDVKLENSQSKITLRVINMMGQSVYTESRENVKDTKFDINLNNIVSGQYIVLVTTASSNQIMVQKVVVNKQ